MRSLEDVWYPTVSIEILERFVLVVVLNENTCKFKVNRFHCGHKEFSRLTRYQQLLDELSELVTGLRACSCVLRSEK